MYKVLLEAGAERDLDNLERSVRERVIEQFLLLKENPRRGAKKLKGTKNAWRIRTGSWRVIYEINDTRKEIKIYRIKHRSRAY